MNEPVTTHHEKIMDIAWGDMDALGHVNNARYFDYFQEARIEWLRVLNIPMGGATGPVVIHVDCTYLKPIVYPATIHIYSKVQNIGHSSMVMAHDVYHNEALMAQGSSKIVWVDYQLGKSVPLPEIIRTIWQN